MEKSVTKAVLWFLAVASLAGTLAGIAEAKVKSKNLASVNQTESSIAIDPAGFPHVAYHGADGRLYHARFNGRTWQRELVDQDQYYGNAIAIDAQGHIHIVYGAERFNGSTYTYPLVYSYFNGTSWQVTDLPVNGFNPRIALDADGHPRVLFRGSSSSTYGYAEYDGTNWQYEETGLPWSWYSNGLTLDAGGSAHISYSINGSGCFYATNKSGPWETTKLAPLDGGAPTAIALDNAGNPHVVIGLGGALVSYTYDGSSWTNETMLDFNDADPKIHATVDTQIAMATDDQGRAQVMVSVSLSSGNRYGEISVFVFDGGAGWNGLLVDPKNTGYYPSMALDTNGVAYVTYCGPLVHDQHAKAKWARLALSDLTGTWTNVGAAGSTVTGTLNVTNHGLEKSAKTTASLWLSDDATVDVGDTLLPVTLNIKSLLPGGSIAVPMNFQYGGTLAGKQLIAVIDPDSNTADRNQLDNTIAVAVGP